MNTESHRLILETLSLVGACALVMTLGGCASDTPRRAQIPSNYATWDVREGAAPRLLGEQEIAIRNAYGAPAKVGVIRLTNSFGRTTIYDVDLQQFTDSAVSMLQRRMEKDEININATAAKVITLRVHNMAASNLHQGNLSDLSRMGIASVTLEAEFGNGKKTSYQRESKGVGGWTRAFDGAVVLALTALLNDKEFLAYVGEPPR